VTVGVIYTVSLYPSDCFAGNSAFRAPVYVAPEGQSRVEDLDSKGVPADVTYCPNSHFAFTEPLPGRFRHPFNVRILWHRACSFLGKRRDQDRIGQEEERKQLLQKQASDQ
jgi:hypothetical protein